MRGKEVEIKTNLLEGFRVVNNIKSIAIMINASNYIDSILDRFIDGNEDHVYYFSNLVRSRYVDCIIDAINVNFNTANNGVFRMTLYYAVLKFTEGRTIENLHALFYDANRLFDEFALWFNFAYDGEKNGMVLSHTNVKEYEMRLTIRNKYHQSFNAIEKRIEHRMKHGLRGKINFTIEVLKKVRYGYEFKILFGLTFESTFDEVCSMMHYRFGDTSGKPWRNCFIMDIKER